MSGIRSMPVLGVRDVAASVKHYQDVLGFAVGGIWGEDGAPPAFAIVGFGDITIALDHDAEAKPRGHGWAAYLYVADVDALHQTLSANGAAIVRKPEDAFYGCRDMDVRDLDGHLLAFGQDLQPGPRGPGL